MATWGARGGDSRRNRETHINIDALIDLDDLAEQKDPLEQVGKLPRISDAVQQRRLLGGFWGGGRGLGFDVAPIALPRRRHPGAAVVCDGMR
jgi:hypothetical protein